MKSTTLFLTSLGLYSSTVSAWGSLGHTTIALVAQNYITSDAKTWLESHLGTASTADATYLSDVANWADTYRSTAAGKFSAPWHYLDAEDNPPAQCNVDLQRDCSSSGCVVTAISNYTTRARDATLSPTEQRDALRFLVHFIGDVHQPLHVEATQVGGNKISVKFDAKTTNLHAVWDTSLPEKLIGGNKLADAQRWAASLIASIDSGAYKTSKSSWLTGTDVADPTDSVMAWAREANALVCTVVMPNGPDVLVGAELDGSYYDGAIGTVQEQVAKAGYRLAAWLNLVATNNSGGLKIRALLGKREPLSYLPDGFMNEQSPAKIARRDFGGTCNCA